MGMTRILKMKSTEGIIGMTEMLGMMGMARTNGMKGIKVIKETGNYRNTT